MDIPTAILRHHYAFLRPKLSACYRFSQGTFAGTCDNEQDAPIPVNGVPCGSVSFEATFSSEAPGSEALDVADRHFLFFYRGIDRRLFVREIIDRA